MYGDVRKINVSTIIHVANENLLRIVESMGVQLSIFGSEIQKNV